MSRSLVGSGVKILNPEDISSLPFKWDAFTVDRTDPVSDVYNYTLNAVPTGTVTITYTDSSKCEVSGGSVVAI